MHLNNKLKFESNLIHFSWVKLFNSIVLAKLVTNIRVGAVQSYRNDWK